MLRAAQRTIVTEGENEKTNATLASESQRNLIKKAKGRQAGRRHCQWHINLWWRQRQRQRQRHRHHHRHRLWQWQLWLLLQRLI